MRVSRALILLTGLTIAVPVGLGLAYQQTQATAGSTPSIEQLAASGTMPNFSQFTTAPTDNAAVSESLSLLGTVGAGDSVSLSFQAGGDVTEILVAEGDVVTVGQVLARLSSEDAQSAYDEALLALERAQINLDDVLAGPTETEIAQAERSISSAQAAASSSSNEATELQLTQAEMKLEQAQQSYDTLVYQRTHNDYTEAAATQMDAQVGAASFNLEIARLQLEELQNPTSDSASQWSASIRIQQAQNQYDQLLAGSTETQITNAQLQVQSAEEQLATAERTMAKLELTAPVAGTVTALNIAVGDTVSTGTTALEITDLTQLYLQASLNELDLDQVAEGMGATVTFDAISGSEVSATLDRIAWIGAESNGIVEYDVWLRLDIGDTRVLPGMTGEATIALS